jgi:hypothetical protein
VSGCGESEEGWPDFAATQSRLELASPFHQPTAKLKEFGKRHWEQGWAAWPGELRTAPTALFLWVPAKKTGEQKGIRVRG